MAHPANPLRWFGTFRAQVVNRLAFRPERSCVLPEEHLPAHARPMPVRTPDREELEGYLFTAPGADRVLVYFHGRAGNIARRMRELDRMAACGVHVFGASYRGFGASTGRASERGIYTDGQAVFEHVTRVLGFPADRVFLLGRSIGSTVALRVAAGRRLAGLILVSALTSGGDFATGRGWHHLAPFARGVFNNLAWAQRATGPVLMIHGGRDVLVPPRMARRLHARLPEPKRLVVLEHSGHDDIDFREPGRYGHALAEFLAQPGRPAPARAEPALALAPG